MTWILKDDDETAIIQQLTEESDRAAVIIAATILEDRLVVALKAFFVDHPKIADNLFMPSGPLGSFSVKISLGFLMGIFDDDARRELKTIKDIRNLFAHKLTIRDFSSKKIKDLTNSLKIPDRYVGRKLGDILENKRLDMVLYDALPTDERERFLISTQIYIMLLTHAADKSFGASPHKRRF